MKLHHLALTIQSKNEVHKFYEKTLGFNLIRVFELKTDWSDKIFNIKKLTKVFYLEGHGLALELFVDENQKQDNFNHYCLSFSDREAFIKKAEANKVQIIRIPRDFLDLIFIKDASGNIFEIKEENKD